MCARVLLTMTTSIPQGSLLDVLKKKMRQTKEEMERYKDECEEITKRLHLEAMRREEVSCFSAVFFFCCIWGVGGTRPCAKVAHS